MKKLIEQLEEIREGFKEAYEFSDDPLFSTSMLAYHIYADMIITELGGKTLYIDKEGV